MEISAIIDIVFFGFLGLSFLLGLWKGLFKSTFNICYNLVLFLIVWLLMPILGSVIVNMIPKEALNDMTEYMTTSELEEFLSSLIRIFASGIVWFVLRIVLFPIKLIIRRIFRKIIFKGEKRAKTWGTRFGGAAVSVANCFLTFVLILTPFTGVLSTLRDSKGNTKCISLDGFNSCDITNYYTDSTFSKIMSVANLDKGMFRLMSNMKLYGEKINLQQDLKNTFDIYLTLEKKGLSLEGEMDAAALASKLTSEDVTRLGNSISSVKLLVTIIEKVGFKVIEKELDLPEGFDLTKISAKQEIQNLFNIASEIVKLPLFEGTEITDNYYNIVANLDGEHIDGLVESIKKSNLITQLYDTYLVPKFDEMVEEFISSFGGTKTVTINTEGIDFSEELHAILTAVSKFKDTGVIVLNAETNEYELSAKGSAILSNVNETETNELVDSLFESSLISQVIGNVVEPFVIKYFNDTLDKDYTSEDLNLGDVSWSTEIKNIVSLAVLLSKEGVIDAIENDQDMLEAILGPTKEKVSLLGQKMGSSKLITALIPEIIEPTLEETLTSMMEEGTVSLPEDIDWSTEMEALLVAAKVFYDGGAFEDDFDVNTFIAELEVDGEVDEIEELSDAIVSSEVFMAVFPDIIESQIKSIDETLTYDEIVWEEEIENLLRAYKMLSNEGFFADGAETTDIMVDILKVDANIDTLFASNVIYKVVTSKLNTELDSFEFDGETLVVGSTDDFTKSDWKNEIKLLVNALDNEDAVNDFENIGKMDPSASDTQIRINNVSVIVSNLLESKTLGPSITNKVNELLELDGTDKKTQEELTDGVSWSVELTAANELLWNITDDATHETQKDVEIEMIPSFIDSAKETVVVKDLVSTKVKDGLAVIKAEDGTALFEDTFINSLDIFDDNNDGSVNWDNEVSVKDQFEIIHYPGDADYSNVEGGDGDKLTAAMTAAADTTVVKYIVEDTLFDEIKSLVKPYFFEDVDNPTTSETAEYEDYIDNLDIFGADYRKEFNVYDKLQEFDGVSDESDEFGPKLDELKLVLADSTIFGPVAEREIKSRLKSVLGEIDIDNDVSTATNVEFVDSLVIKDINWTNELAVKDGLETMLPLEDFTIDASNVNELFGEDGLFKKIANSVIVASVINSNDIPDEKKIAIDNVLVYNTIVSEIDNLDAPTTGKDALKKIVYFE